MAINFPGPYELRFFYEVDGLAHQHRHSLDVPVDPAPGTPFLNIESISRLGNPVQLDTWVDSVWTELAPIYNTTSSSFGIVELWKYTAGTFDAQFISAYNSAVTPSSPTQHIPAQQATFTFRTIEGGIFKVQLMESVLAGNGVNTYPIGGANYDDIFELFTNGGLSPALGRDTSYPFAALRVSLGPNEAVWRKRYRS